MFSNKNSFEFLSSSYTWLWAALAFQAGYTNAAGFLACASFVSHVSGAGTMVGLSLSELDYIKAIEFISVPLWFVLGAMFSAFMVDRRILKGQPPRYLVVMGVMATTFAAITLFGVSGSFGQFGQVEGPLLLSGNYFLLSILCMLCGMQNACFVSATRGQIRTTHLTGITTDIGIAFVRLLQHEKTSRAAVIEGRGNRIRMLTFLSFSLGSVASAILFRNFEFFAFSTLAFLSTTLWLIMSMKQANADQRKSAFVSHLTSKAS